MKTICSELSEILGCDVEIVKKKRKGISEFQSLIELKDGTELLINRSLSPLEALFVEKWFDKTLDSKSANETSLLLKSDGFITYSDVLKFPMNLWRIQFKSNSEDVIEILKSTFRGDKMAVVSATEIVIFVTKCIVSPDELQGLLESEALTRTEITVGNTVTDSAEIHMAYTQLVELTELASVLRMQTQVVTYDSMFFPLLMKRIKNILKNSKDLNSKDLNAKDLNESKLDVVEFDQLRKLLNQQVKPVNDAELEHTALVFLSNNLNITDTAVALFIHRNTLIYRLNKLEQLTGYDIRKFNDAIHYYLSYLGNKIK